MVTQSTIGARVTMCYAKSAGSLRRRATSLSLRSLIKLACSVICRRTLDTVSHYC
jgi:hypothetical protein